MMDNMDVISSLWTCTGRTELKGDLNQYQGLPFLLRQRTAQPVALTSSFGWTSAARLGEMCEVWMRSLFYVSTPDGKKHFRRKIYFIGPVLPVSSGIF